MKVDVYILRLSVVLLICWFILSVTRAIERPLKNMELRPGLVACASIALLAANAFSFWAMPELFINPAALLLCVFTGISAGRTITAGRIMQAAACAMVAAVAMFFISRMALSGRLDFSEPGLLLALCPLAFALFFRSAPAGALFCAVLAPLFLTLFEAGYDLYVYGYGTLELCSPVLFDAQIAGATISIAAVMLARAPQSRKAALP